MEPKFLTLNNFEIAYFDNEKQADTTLLFIHGNSLNIQLFRNQLNDSVLNQYRIVAPDLPGHGTSAKSDNPEKDYGILSFIDILQQLVKALNLKNIVLVGHSLGGHIAIHLMATLQKKEINVKGMAIMGTPPLTIPPAMEEAFLPNPAMPFAFNSNLTEKETENLACVFSEDYKIMRLAKQAIESTDPLVRPMLGKSIATELTDDENLLLKNANVPLAIFHGEKDQLINLDYIQKQNHKVWQNRVEIIPDTGHCSFAEKPSVFNEKLYPFFKSLS